MEKFGLLTFLLLMLYTYADSPGPGLVKKLIFVEENLSWDDAQEYCSTFYDEIFSVSDWNDLRNLIGAAGKPLSWIGLHRWSSYWYWVDYSADDFFNWFHHENCAAVSSDGDWYDLPCDSLIPSLCQDGQMELHFNDKPDTWLNAKQACEDHHYNFTIIRNFSDTINIILTLNTGVAWIGLSKVKEDTSLPDTWKWRWVNNEPLTYSNWYTSLFCAVMDQTGFWYDHVCFEANPFVCFSEMNNIREYILVKESKNFSEAQSYCKTSNMNLVVVNNQEENAALLSYIREKGGFSEVNVHFWIGLYNDPWIGGYSDIQNWNSNQPDNHDFQNNPIESGMSCVASKDGEWFDENCSNPLPFFCSTTVPSVILVSEPKSWEEALDHCRDTYVDLVSLVSDTEQQAALRKIQGVQNGYVWTGLRFLAGSWFWVYGDSLQYENWLDDGQKQCPGNLRCGALAAASGKWEPRSCEEKQNFLCFQK